MAPAVDIYLKMAQMYTINFISLRHCLRSSMDRILVSGTSDMSSNLVGDTSRDKCRFSTFVSFFFDRKSSATSFRASLISGVQNLNYYIPVFLKVVKNNLNKLSRSDTRDLIFHSS